MTSISKAAPVSIRFSEEQRARLKRAADILGKRRGEAIPISALARELAVRGAEDIIAEAKRAA